MIQDIAPKELRLPYKTISPLPEDAVFVFRGSTKREDRALLRLLDDGSIQPPRFQDLRLHDTKQIQFLFSIDDKNYFLLNNGGADDIELPEYEYVTLLTFSEGKVINDVSLAGMTAYHLFFWYRENMYCGKCGHKTVPYSKERAVQCPSCKNLVFPKLMPAVIIAVRNGEKLLVSRYAGREYTGISLLAGFCEIGESLEQTVAREVKEEVGLQVKNIIYFGSQPWGMDSNLLMGFYADADGSTEIHRDEQELAKAGWMDRSEIKPVHNFASLTMTMIEAFRTGKI